MFEERGKFTYEVFYLCTLLEATSDSVPAFFMFADNCMKNGNDNSHCWFQIYKRCLRKNF